MEKRTCKGCGQVSDRSGFRTVTLPHHSVGRQVERHGVCDACASKYEAVRDRVNAILNQGGNVACYSFGCHEDDAVFPGQTYNVQFITREGGFKIFLTPNELEKVVPYHQIWWDNVMSIETFEDATGITFTRFPQDFPVSNKDSTGMSRWSHVTASRKD